MDENIRPLLAADGGNVLIEDFQDNVLRIRYQGACGSCSKAESGTLVAIQSILQFSSFLFEHDRDDVSEAVRAIYDLLGPTDTFLLWAKHLVGRALPFFVRMYSNLENMARFEKITAQGMKSVKSTILEINLL